MDHKYSFETELWYSPWIEKGGGNAISEVRLSTYGVPIKWADIPDSKVHGACMGPTCGRHDPGGGLVPIPKVL